MKLFIIFLFVLCNGLILRSQDDSVYYAKITNTRTYMNIDRVSVTEYWFAKDKFCSLNSQVKSIFRKDLGVVYITDLRTGTVRTETIKPAITSPFTEYTVDFKYIGQHYIPVYDWNKPKLLSPVKVGNYICDHHICEGDADYDQISLEYLAAKTSDQVLAGMLNSSIMSFGASVNKREPLAGLLAGNKNLIILRIVEIVENPIAPHITTTLTSINLN
jgi:hypothetical protein